MSQALIWDLNFDCRTRIFQGSEIYIAIDPDHAFIQNFQPEVLVCIYGPRRKADPIIADRQREIILAPFGQYRDFVRPGMFFYVTEQLFECKENCTLDILWEGIRFSLGLKIQLKICTQSYFLGVFQQQIRQRHGRFWMKRFEDAAHDRVRIVCSIAHHLKIVKYFIERELLPLCDKLIQFYMQVAQILTQVIMQILGNSPSFGQGRLRSQHIIKDFAVLPVF